MAPGMAGAQRVGVWHGLGRGREEGAPFVRRPAGGQGQHGPEAAALAEQAVGADLPTHQLDQPAADGEAQAGAAIFAGRRVVGLFEGFEELFLLGRAEADAAVLDLEAQPDRLVVAGGGVVETQGTEGDRAVV